MSKRDGGWLLPATVNPARTCVTLKIPKDANHMAAFVGALQELSKWWNWQRDSSHIGIQAALVWQDILADLIGQINYANPEIELECVQPVNMRLTEECVLEFTNDGGETWQVVTNWAAAAECFVGPQGETGPTGAQGETGPTGAQGETGVIGAQVVRVDGDTAPDLTYNGITGILTATLQEQWFRGIQIIPADVPLGLTGHKIEVQTYEGQPDWQFLGWIPPYLPPQEFTDQPETTFTDEEIACGMATALMVALNETWLQELQMIDDTASAIEALGELAEIFYASGISIALQGALDFVQIIYNQTRATLEATFTPTNYDDMQQELYCLLLAAGGYDGSVLVAWRDWVNSTWTVVTNPGAWSFGNQITFMDLSYFKRKALIGALDPLTTCQFYECDDWIEGAAPFGTVYDAYLNGATINPGLVMDSGNWVANSGAVVTGAGPLTLEFTLTLPDRLKDVTAIRLFYERSGYHAGNFTRELDLMGSGNDWNSLVTNWQPTIYAGGVYEQYTVTPATIGANRIHVRIVTPTGGQSYTLRVFRIGFLLPAP